LRAAKVVDAKQCLFEPALRYERELGVTRRLWQTPLGYAQSVDQGLKMSGPLDC
jgi:hypothetical protein